MVEELLLPLRSRWEVSGVIVGFRGGTIIVLIALGGPKVVSLGGKAAMVG